MNHSEQPALLMDGMAWREFQSLIDTFFKLDEVRYAVVIDSFGERLAGGMKPGVQTLGSRSSEEKLEIQAVLVLKMAEGFEPENGRLHFSALSWDKVIAIFCLLSPDRVVAVTVRGDTPLQEIFKIENLMQKFKHLV